MQIRTWIAAALFLAATYGPRGFEATAAEPARTNVIVILADDLGWGDVSCNGRKQWSTPNIDLLAADGMRFTRFYTAAVVCAPSRAALMTGKSTIHNGVSRNDADLPASEVTLAEVLKANGYATALFGKWHHGRPRPGEKSYVHPMDQGFDEFFGFTDAGHAWEQFPTQLWDGRKMVPVTGLANDQFTNHAVDFLKRKKDGPFFLYLPYNAPHFHIQAPPDEVALHRGKFNERNPAQPINATYAAMITRLDKCVGRVLKEVEDLGLTKQTLVLFTSDHGATFEVGNKGASNYHDSNAPFRGQKRTLWEGGVRVPGMVRWPGHVPASSISDAPYIMTDIFPTVLAACGIRPDPAWKLDGTDVLSCWTGQVIAPERTLFWEWRGEGYRQFAALRDRLKLVITSDGRPELFDVVADPAERRNVIAEHPDVARDLQSELKAWLATEVKN